MSFQYVIDNATELSITKRQRVSQTVSRSGVVKTASLGGQIYEIRARLPDGPRWSENRSFIEQIEALDRTTVSTISINNPGHDYIIGYQGVQPDPNTVTVTPSATPNRLSITGGVTISGGGNLLFKAGDYIQLGNNGTVYTVTSNVAATNTIIDVHRPVKEPQGLTFTLNVGQNVSWNVICVSFPTWTLFGYDQVRWDGDFVFAEVV